MPRMGPSYSEAKIDVNSFLLIDLIRSLAEIPNADYKIELLVGPT
jgi:hypothetical protein